MKAVDVVQVKEGTFFLLGVVYLAADTFMKGLVLDLPIDEHHGLGVYMLFEHLLDLLPGRRSYIDRLHDGGTSVALDACADADLLVRKPAF